jgi:predicted secreted protein
LTWKQEVFVKRWRLISLYAMLGVSLAATRGSFAGQVEPPERPSTTPGVTVVNEKTGGVVSLKVGAVLEVRLEANHTTGYSWISAPVANPVLMRQGAARYEEHASGGKAGVGGMEIWRFKAVKAGKQGLQFEYRRPWEKGAPAAKAVTFSVTVE